MDVRCRSVQYFVWGYGLEVVMYCSGMIDGAVRLDEFECYAVWFCRDWFGNVRLRVEDGGLHDSGRGVLICKLV